jgi:hypothetical protein
MCTLDIATSVRSCSVLGRYDDFKCILILFAATEILESAYVKDLIPLKQYTLQCNKLIESFQHYQHLLVDNGVLSEVDGVKPFMDDYGIRLPQAFRRLVKEGVPAKPRADAAADDGRRNAALVLETVRH